jgi:hypothetical protein
VFNNSRNYKKELVEWMRFKYDFSNWNKIYSTAIIKKNNLLFNEEMRVWEDLLFNLCYLQFSNRITTIANGLYNYRIHPMSVMNIDTHDTITEYNLLFESFRDFCKQHEFTEMHDTFRKEISRGFYYTIIPKVYHEIKKQPISFQKKVSLFSRELRKVNEDLFVFNSFELKGLQGFKKRLLLKKSYLLFSLIISIGGLRIR